MRGILEDDKKLSGVFSVLIYSLLHFSKCLQIPSARNISYFAMYNAHLHFVHTIHGIIIPIIIPMVCNHYTHV